MRITLGPAAPATDSTAWVAPTAVIAGAVTIRSEASVWFGAVLRGDGDEIAIGSGTNVQDGSIVHADPGYGVKVGQRVSVGHGAVLHGCTIGDKTLIGMRAVVLNGAVIAEQCLVAAGSVVLEGSTFEPRTLIAGVPAKARRPLTDAECADIERNAEDYVRLAARYRGAVES